jgi:hypothetical protein
VKGTRRANLLSAVLALKCVRALAILAHKCVPNRHVFPSRGGQVKPVASYPAAQRRLVFMLTASVWCADALHLAHVHACSCTLMHPCRRQKSAALRGAVGSADQPSRLRVTSALIAQGVHDGDCRWNGWILAVLLRVRTAPGPRVSVACVCAVPVCCVCVCVCVCVRACVRVCARAFVCASERVQVERWNRSFNSHAA